jgi:hypothetical protein
MWEYVVWAAYNWIRFIWESSSSPASSFSRLFLYFISTLILPALFYSVIIYVIYCLFMLRDWPQPHSYYLYTCADPARPRGTSYLAGVAFWQPWTCMSQVLEPGHWILYSQEIIAFLISSWRPLFSLFSRSASFQLVAHFPFAREDSSLVLFIYVLIFHPCTCDIVLLWYYISYLWSTYLYSDYCFYHILFRD